MDAYARSWFIVDSLVVVYDGARHLRDEEHSLEEKEAHKRKRKPWTLREFGGKTFWDWLQLLIVPVVLSLITVVFAWRQDISQDQIEEKRAKVERELAEKRADDEALQAYLDQMGTLLLERDLRSSTEDNATEDSKEARTLARARTLTVLSRLDSARKERLLQFLYEAGLLRKATPVIDLNGADLSEIVLRNNNISGSGPFLIDVSRNQTYVVGMDPSKAANLSGAILSKANLEGALLYTTDLSEANLSNADLSEATLWDTDLFNANLSDANLSKADLGGADLSDADLSWAHLSGAKGITNEELNRQAKSLAYATMPNGQKYGDWLKSKDSGDGKNDGSS